MTGVEASHRRVTVVEAEHTSGLKSTPLTVRAAPPKSVLHAVILFPELEAAVPDRETEGSWFCTMYTDAASADITMEVSPLVTTFPHISKYSEFTLEMDTAAPEPERTVLPIMDTAPFRVVVEKSMHLPAPDVNMLFPETVILEPT